MNKQADRKATQRTAVLHAILIHANISADDAEELLDAIMFEITTGPCSWAFGDKNEQTTDS